MKKIIILVLILLLVIISSFLFKKEDEQEPKIYEISSPVLISGKARGYWFFEGSFPIRLEDDQGNLISSGFVTAQSDWMTEDYVPFSGRLDFMTTADSGVIVFQKDNPSDLPEFDDQLTIPVSFKKRQVTFFFYDSEKDLDAEGNVLCSQRGLIPIEKEISLSKTPIQDTVKLLLKEIGLEDVELVGANLKDKKLVLEFRDPLYKTSGGSCRVGILWMQIRETAKQFPEVDEVSFIPEDLFQP